MMENGVANGLPTNHDRDHGAGSGNSGPVATSSSAAAVNGHMPHEEPSQPRMNDLPDEIQHITHGYIPLGVLLSRLAQSTHNDLQSKVLQWARMPVPSVSMVNGNSAHHDGSLADDNSDENKKKKLDVLLWAQEAHAKWVKALVIASWSRKAEPVSKLIDLMNHINMQRRIYDESLDYLINIKRDLTFARIPNPDLHTALHVLSSGEAPWMPDLGYIEPPPLSPKEQLQWINNLNTLLSLRLNIEDHDKIPHHFQDYTIESGRVTFKVPGEFEVDLTIADEDFEKQFWFIDFRFAFTPAPNELSDRLRMFLEQRVNAALEKEGLDGCYKLLHEFVLTHKITEYVRQARELSLGQWVDTLKVERLHRSMSIQYWVGRYSEGPKSWIIMGVDSGKKAGQPHDRKGTSKLSLRWFRDNKEIKDVVIPLDEANISAERLLNSVIGRHVGYILSTIHSRLASNDRFVKREAALALRVANDKPIQSALKMQLGSSDYITVKIAPTTGLFAITPQTDVTAKGEHVLNRIAKNPVEEGVPCLENIRWAYTVEELRRRGKSLGWEYVKRPVSIEDVKRIIQTRDLTQHYFFRRLGLPDQWHVMLSQSLSGDRWWLVEITPTSNNQPGRVVSFAQLPLSSGLINPSDKFFTDLTTFTGSTIQHIVDLRALRSRRIGHNEKGGFANPALPTNMKIPTIFIRMSDVLGQNKAPDADKSVAWASDFLQVTYKGVRDSVSRTRSNDEGVDQEGSQRLVEHVDVRFRVAHASRLSNLNGIVERDVAFNERLGVFALRLEAEIGRPILDTLAHRVGAIEKLVECTEAIRQSDRDITCEEITLNKVTCSYSDHPKNQAENGTASGNANAVRWRAVFDLGQDKITLRFERGNPQLRVLNFFQDLVNSPLGFKKAPFFLSGTTGIHRVFDSIEDSWEEMSLKNLGRVEIYAGALDWFFIRYSMVTGAKREERRVTLQVRLREHRNETRWHVFRGEPGVSENPDDIFKRALHGVWNRNGSPWANLVNSAACPTDEAAGTLLKAADEAIRAAASRASPVMTKKEPPNKSAQSKAQQGGAAKGQAAKNNQMTPRMNQQQGHAGNINNRGPPSQANQPGGDAGVVILDD